MSVPKKILIVDDLESFRELYGIALERAGYAVTKAIHGKDGLEKARAGTPDLILLDVDMPVMDGVETISALKTDPATKNIKVIFLTSFGDPSGGGMDAKYAKELGAEDFISKSTELRLVVERVDNELK